MTSNAQPLSPSIGARLAKLALGCVHREYPNKLSHVLTSVEDVKSPRELTPAFYGCFDWHSAVHGHWLLARAARSFPSEPFAAEAKLALDRSLTADNIAAEVRYLGDPARAGFERPYGLAWLLQLGAELREWNDADAARWRAAIAPLEDLAALRLRLWIPKLGFPIRSGEHSQTAFAFALAWDWATVRKDAELLAVLSDAAQRFYRADLGCPLAFEPSGHDFLSPCLAEADFMRRTMSAEAYAEWLSGALPSVPRDGREWLQPAVPRDRADGKLAHLDGLNLSRAWMLDGIARALPEGDERRAALLAARERHAVAGLSAVTGEHYAGGHWLGSFAMYLLTGRGAAPVAAP